MKSKNQYSYPVTLDENVEMTYDKSRMHKGRLKYAVDFITKSGTPILASLDGIVVDVKQDSNIGGDADEYDAFGNYIEIKHDNDEYSIYEHIRINGSLVKVGDVVKTGQLIGYSGFTGLLAGLGPHLHFDVHKYFGKGPEEYDSVEIVWKK